MKRKNAQELAALGAKYLDVIEPNWPHIIPANVNTRFECECALAHLYRSFSAGVVKLELTEPEAFGFYVRGNQDSESVICDYALLTEAWRDERAHRLTPISQTEMEMAVGMVGADG